MSFGTWPTEDLLAMVAALNAGAVTFAGVDFRGWHAEGDAFTVPAVGTGTPVVFGRLSHGLTRGMRTYGSDDPTRRGEILIEIFSPGSGSLRIATIVLGGAVAVLDALANPTLFGRETTPLQEGKEGEPFANYTAWGARSGYQANTIP